MNNFSVQIFATDLPEVFEHYKRAFNAKLLFDGKADDGTLIHLQLDIMGASLGVAPKRPDEIIRGNVVQLCLPFSDEASLRTAYDVLAEGGHGEGLHTFPWSPLQGYVTDKFGVMWCIGL
jgi:PhnB protein